MQSSESTALQPQVLYWLFIQLEDVQTTQLNGTKKKTWTLRWLHCTVIKTHCSQFPSKHWPNNDSLVFSASFSASWCFNVYNTHSLPRTSCWNIQGHNKNIFTSRVSAWFQRLAYSLQMGSAMRRSEDQWSWPVWSQWKANTELRG